jgi:hypothetical protein
MWLQLIKYGSNLKSKMKLLEITTMRGVKKP